MPRKSLTLLLLSLVIGSALYGADVSSTEDASQVKITLQPAVVRDFILKSIAADRGLRKFFDEESLPGSIPPFYDVYYPGEWANWREIGFGVRYPFLKLGEWRLVFGAREMLNDQGMKHDSRVLQRVRLIRKRYFADGLPNEIECTEISLYVRPTGTVDDWRDGTIRMLELESWEVLNYRVTDHGSYSRGTDARCLAAGGSRKDQAGKTIKMTITHEAFIGRVERVVDTSQ